MLTTQSNDTPKPFAGCQTNFLAKLAEVYWNARDACYLHVATRAATDIVPCCAADIKEAATGRRETAGTNYRSRKARKGLASDAGSSPSGIPSQKVKVKLRD